MARLVEVATARLIRDLHRPFVTALRRTNQVLSIAVRLTDADGFHGYGEAPQIWRVTGESLAGIEACVLGPLAAALLGREFTAETAGTVQQVLADAVAANTGARAACEVAVLDLLARRAGLSLAAFLGSTVTEVGTDITIAAQVDDPSAESVPSGFVTAKIKVGLDPADVERVIRIQREAVEPVRIRIDANQAWDVPTTVANVETLQAAGVDLEFIEQPLPAWDLPGHAELRRRLVVPVMLDESVFSVHDLHRAIELGSADLVNIKLAKCGGVHAGLEIARQARKAELGVMVGSMMESELGVSAAAALAAVLAPTSDHDLDAAWWSIDPALDAETPYRNGRFELSASPGLSGASSRIEVDSLAWTSSASTG
jgi:L-alanine-DL-glutamate epimerase-like enolase superfamily enzyme